MSRRISRCLIFKQTARIIPEGAPIFHPMSSRRILYVGRDLALLEHLRGELRDCRIVRCPGGSNARDLIRGINYSLLLFDEELHDTTGQALAEFSCSLARRACTPFIIIKKPYDFESLARAILEVLAAKPSTAQNAPMEPATALAGAPEG